MRIAILGTRGIPANYGGFETFAEKVSIGLAARGHDVTVYCRSSYSAIPDRVWRGVRRVVLPSVRRKYLDTPVHTFLSMLHVMVDPPDIVYVCNAANSMFLPLPRWRGSKVLINVDGIEWKRSKWGWAGRTHYRISEAMAARASHVVIADSLVIRDYYRERFGVQPVYVSYGALIVDRTPGLPLPSIGVEEEKFILFVSRLEPENNAHLLVRAFEDVRTDMKLAIVGGAPYASAYIEDLRRTKDRRILFPGPIYGDGYLNLQRRAYVYVNAMEVGGTHPAILDSMGAGNCVLVSDIPENVETVAHAGVTFRNKDVDDLRAKLQALVDDPARVKEYRRRAVERIRERYTWEHIVDRYEELFLRMLGQRSSR
ncbi:MAG: DUF1972 domain-containing protein [Planctomycetes bacterium]|nr:DUF1972 domain-containing protein [Planctomycetota bacterium]